MKGLGPKISAQGPKFLDCYEKIRLPSDFKIPIAVLCLIS